MAEERVNWGILTPKYQSPVKKQATPIYSHMTESSKHTVEQEKPNTNSA